MCPWLEVAANRSEFLSRSPSITRQLPSRSLLHALSPSRSAPLFLFSAYVSAHVCVRVRRVVSDVVRAFADWHLVEITRSKPSALLSELQQVQFTGIGTKRMQKWIGRHERLTNWGWPRKKDTMMRRVRENCVWCLVVLHTCVSTYILFSSTSVEQ